MTFLWPSENLCGPIRIVFFIFYRPIRRQKAMRLQTLNQLSRMRLFWLAPWLIQRLAPCAVDRHYIHIATPPMLATTLYIVLWIYIFAFTVVGKMGRNSAWHTPY